MSVISSSLRLVKAGTGATNNSIVVVWLVKCSSSTDTAATVLTNSVTPNRGDDPPAGLDIPSDYVAWDINVVPYNDSLYWFTISVEYRVPPLVWFTNVLDYVAKGGGGADYFVDTDYDANGLPVKNTAGDFVDPPFQKPASEGNFWVEFRTQELGLWPTRNHTMNSTIIWGMAKWQVRTGSIEWSRGIEDGVRFWQIRVPLFYRESTWNEKWKSRGFNYLDGTEKKQITLEDGSIPNIPQPLDENGAPVDDPSLAFEIETQLFRESDMSLWGMPNPFELED